MDAIRRLKDLDVKDIRLLSGDKQEIVNQFAERLGVDKAYGNLLPEDKAAYIERLTAETDKLVAFVGDGMNDAPVLALSDVGIAWVDWDRMRPSRARTWLSKRTSPLK